MLECLTIYTSMPLTDDHRELFCCQDRVTGEEIIRLGVTRGFCEHLSDSEKVCQVPSVGPDNFKHLGLGSTRIFGFNLAGGSVSKTTKHTFCT